MISFTVYDIATGKIFRSGTCQEHMLEHQCPAGNYAVLPIASDPNSQQIDLATKLLIPYDRPEIKPDYRMNRARNYPSAGDQLDAIWKALHALPLTQEGEDMRLKIQEVKQMFPKESE